VKFARGGQACNARANNADFMIGLSGLGDTVGLFYQGAVVKT
jgi:hypothetical protein